MNCLLLPRCAVRRTLRRFAPFLSVCLLLIALTGPAEAQIYRRLHAFRAQNSDGARPKALVHARDGFWYGVTQYGGAYNYGGPDHRGTFFRQDASGHVTVLHSFTGLQDGAEPITLLQASDGFLYGIVRTGFGSGGIFRADTRGHLTIIHAFRQSSEGNSPTVLAEGQDGRLYGATQSGGASSRGTLFRMDRDGKNYTVLRSLDTNTGYQATALMRATDGNLYGAMYFNGGMFRLTPAGEYTLLRRFQDPGGYGVTGLIQGNDGFLYGVTESGFGNASPGTFFKADTTGNITLLHTFQQQEGTFPTSIVQGADNAFYIVTVNDAAHNRGSLLRWSGGLMTLLNAFDRRHDINTSIRLFNDRNGAVYGATETGGTNSAGTLFRVDTEGEIETTYSFAFHTDGANPVDLLKTRDGNLYGVTASGGEYNRGTVFRIHRSGLFTRLHSFDSTDGEIPRALTEGSDGNLYGFTSLGGAFERGTLFRISPQGAFTLLYSFGPPNGYGNPATILRGADGQIYAIVSYLEYPTLVRVSPDGEITRILKLDDSPVGRGLNSVMASPDGGFYLATSEGPLGEAGQISRVDTAGVVQPIYGFHYTNQNTEGIFPRALVVGRDSMLYGATNTSFFEINPTGQFRVLVSVNEAVDNYVVDLISEPGRWYGLSASTLFQFTSTSSPSRLHTFNVFRMDGSSPQTLLTWQKNSLVGALQGGGHPPIYIRNGSSVGGSVSGGFGLVFQQLLGTPEVTPAGENLRITRSALVTARGTYRFRCTLTLTNLGSQAIESPVGITVNLADAHQRVINQEGTYNDVPFIAARNPIPPGASILVPIEIYNPLLTPISFNLTAYQGPF